jgi:uncharacterized protein YidB (DUF937 family)
MSIFDTYTSALGGTDTTAARFAALALEYVQSPAHGGLPGLLDRFRTFGFDDQVRSWIGDGRNLNVTRQDVERVMGAADLQDLAGKAGVAVDAAAQEMAALLPQFVNMLTPSGLLPDGDAMAEAFAAIKSRIGMI